MTTTEIAKNAGVSQATVSRVLNGGRSVAPSTVARVKKAARDLGYPLPLDASGRAAGVSLVAALVLSSDQFHSYASSYSLMLQGAAEALSELGAGLLTVPVLSGGVLTPEQIPSCIRNNKVDGLLLIGHRPLAETLQVLEGIPRVWVTSHRDEMGDVAVVGNERVGELAADYLLDRGHKSLGFLNTMVGYPSVERRCEYFTFHAKRKGVPVQVFSPSVDGCAVAVGGLDYAALEERVAVCVDRFISAKNRPTGLFVPMDMQVAMVYRVLQKRGLTIGRKGDVELIGSDDERAALLGLTPRPATISIGARTMGSRAVSQLIWRIRNASVPERMRVMVEPELILGDES